MCIACKQVERCSTSLVILEVKIENHGEISLHSHKDGYLKKKKKVSKKREKKACWCSDGDASIESVDQFGGNWHVNNFETSDP